MLFGCPKTNFGASRGQPHSPNAYHSISIILTQRSQGVLQQGWLPKPVKAPTEVWTVNFQILIAIP